ncbi:hypothetical protein BDW42DRAFT_176503 [Aspergillus taichungensis]|uniref:Uncharacterized protein n=1 Tax=Aspergillus taichungensis TaxID=482145 RepID=A0A2J5HKW9_9EURO|nr:hypothetical protein BDW42DRAFT_176503 [Aspergillus taichungensis]
MMMVYRATIISQGLEIHMSLLFGLEFRRVCCEMRRCGFIFVYLYICQKTFYVNFWEQGYFYS